VIKARGREKKLLCVISDLQAKVGFARSLHFDDRSPGAFERAQNLLADAFRLCVDTTAEYDPESFEEVQS